MTSASSFLGGGSFRPKGPPTEITSGFGTFFPDADGMWYRYTATAAGGGGGGGDTTNGGGGGGAGATRRGIVKIPIAGWDYVIPAGGAPETAGGSLTFGRIIVPGGRGGRSRASGGQGGNGGGPAPVPNVGPLDNSMGTYVPEGVTPGGGGGNSFAVMASTGSPAMPPSYPLAGSQITNNSGLTITGAGDTQGAAGGSSEFGDGGAIAANDAVGNNATGYGGGGGGGGKAASGTRAGGTGTGGRLYLEPLGVW